MNLEKEQEIINKCKSDLSYFNEIYKTYLPDVYRYCYSKLQNKAETEDVVSNTFLSALENIESYQFMNKSIKNWLFIIARNLIYKQYKKIDTYEFDENWHGIEDDKILQKVITEDTARKIEEFILKFKPPVPEIIRLKIWEEMSFEEIAEILSKSVSAVKMAYYRALEKVYQEFETERIEA